MLKKEVLPLHSKETEYLLCDLNKDYEKFKVPGKMGLVKDDDVIAGKPPPGRPVVEVGAILFAEVLGRTLSGRPLLSTRRLFRRLAWHRVMQIKQLNEPIEEKLYLRERTLLSSWDCEEEFPYGAQVRIGETNRSIADLESEPGIFLSNKERVFQEAEMMAKKYKEKLPPLTPQWSNPLPVNSLPFENETLMLTGIGLNLKTNETPFWIKDNGEKGHGGDKVSPNLNQSSQSKHIFSKNKTIF